MQRPVKFLLPLPGMHVPAFPEDIDLINRIYEDHFGAPLIPDGQIALLNKVPDQDRMEEVIVGGGVAGIIRYFPKDRRWEPSRGRKPAGSLPRRSVSSWSAMMQSRSSATRV